jgi:hypothetical protein
MQPPPLTRNTYRLSDRINFDGEAVPDGQVDLDPLRTHRVVHDADVHAGIVNLIKNDVT